LVNGLKVGQALTASMGRRLTTHLQDESAKCRSKMLQKYGDVNITACDD
jgi:hypothetical protein